MVKRSRLEGKLKKEARCRLLEDGQAVFLDGNRDGRLLRALKPGGPGPQEERSVARVSSLLVATGRKVRQINRSRWSYRNQVSRIAQTALRGRRSGVDRRVDGEEEEW